MKAIISAALLATSLLIYGCKKQTDTDSPVIPAGMTAKINGIEWSASFCQSDINGLSATEFYLTIQSSDSVHLISPTYPEIRLGVDYFQNKPGTYTIGNGSTNSAQYFINTLGSKASAGTITITQFSAHNIQGTFSFTTDSASVTNGQFNVPVF